MTTPKMTIQTELQDLVTGLLRAGVPAEVVGAELIANGSALVGSKHGARLAQKILEAAIDALPTDEGRRLAQH